MIDDPKFDLFSGESDKDAVWMEAVSGLSNARERMEALAQQVPGKYFLFSSSSRSILAKIDTSQRRTNVLRARA
jgi:hypothetical protein